jgi:hypothetical protein
MQGRVVILDTGWQTLTTTGTGSGVYDLLEAKLGSSQAGFLIRAKIMQSSEEASTEAEELKVAVKRGSGSYTSASDGSAATVTKGQTGDPSSGLAVSTRTNKTQAIAGSGALETIEAGTWNVLAGEWEFTPTPELMFPIGPSQGVILSIDEGPADGMVARAILELLITHG